MKKMNLNDLKNDMWIEVCEGDDTIKMSDEYKKLIGDIKDGEVDGVNFILNFYKLLDILIDNDLIEFEGGDIDWCCIYFDEYGEGDKFSEYYDEYLKLIK